MNNLNLTFEQEILEKPIGKQGQAIINRLERLIKETKELINKNGQAKKI